MTTRVLDVSDLPMETADSRALLWWGNVAMLAIEGTMFAMLIATYLYLKTANFDWPPQSVQLPPVLWPSIGLALLIISAFFMAFNVVSLVIVVLLTMKDRKRATISASTGRLAARRLTRGRAAGCVHRTRDWSAE